MATSLYEISANLRELFERSFESEDDQDFKAELEQELTGKTDSVAAYYRKMQADILNAENEKKRINDILTVRKNKLTRYKEYIYNCLDLLQVNSIEGDNSKLSFRKGVAKLSILDEKKIPINFIKTVNSIDKAMLKEALKNGEIIDGAKLIDGDKSLIIK